MDSMTTLRVFPLCLFLWALLTINGCTPQHPDRVSPVTLPVQFSTSGGAVELPQQWWLSLADSELNGLMEQAFAGNLDLKAAWSRLEQARAQVRIAGAALWPTFDGELSARRSWLSGQDDVSRFGAAVVAGYEIDLWGRIRSEQDAAILDAAAAAEDLQTAAISLSAQLATTWYQVLEQESQRAIVQQQLRTNGQLLELINLQFRTGQVGIADVLQQRQLVESSRGELAKISAQREVLRQQLALLIGVPRDDLELDRLPGFPELSPLPKTGVPVDMVQRRPDIRSAWNRLQAADRRLAVAIAERFPRLSLSGELGSEAGTIGDLFEDWLASLAGNLVGPIIDQGRRRAVVDRERATVNELLHGYGQSVLEALSEVEVALARETEQRRYLAQLEIQEALAEQANRRIRDRYVNGDDDYQRVLTGLLSLQGLQRSRLSAQRQLYEYRIQLCRALAGGWELVSPQPKQGS